MVFLLGLNVYIFVFKNCSELNISIKILYYSKRKTRLSLYNIQNKTLLLLSLLITFLFQNIIEITDIIQNVYLFYFFFFFPILVLQMVCVCASLHIYILICISS